MSPHTIVLTIIACQWIILRYLRDKELFYPYNLLWWYVFCSFFFNILSYEFSALFNNNVVILTYYLLFEIVLSVWVVFYKSKYRYYLIVLALLLRAIFYDTHIPLIRFILAIVLFISAGVLLLKELKNIDVDNANTSIYIQISMIIYFGVNCIMFAFIFDPNIERKTFINLMIIHGITLLAMQSIWFTNYNKVAKK